MVIDILSRQRLLKSTEPEQLMFTLNRQYKRQAMINIIILFVIPSLLFVIL